MWVVLAYAELADMLLEFLLGCFYSQSTHVATANKTNAID